MERIGGENVSAFRRRGVSASALLAGTVRHGPNPRRIGARRFAHKHALRRNADTGPLLSISQMDGQQRDVRGRDAADPARLPKGARADFREFLAGFKTQAFDIFIIEPIGNILRF